ncbi:MAG: hypothetical protein H6738_01885 [Alphaproteobacteria bacterium]|nr:hypothetical protein [Alphaproteobacteria bacterium]MCB9695519.1 hypothetical protein [Alphaproteobacteria bacterium]
MLALVLTWMLFLRVALAGDVGADAPPEPAPGVEDPRRLLDLGREALAAGDRDRARALFEQRMTRLEVLRYTSLRPLLSKAFLAEQMGELDVAAASYRDAIPDNPFQTALVLRVLSQHPDREALVAETYAYLREAVAAMRRGEQALIYTTTKGDPRYLEEKTIDELVADAREGKVGKYCYVDKLDVRKVERLPDIVLDYCVIGSIYSPTVTFDKLVVQHSVVLGDTDLGRTFLGAKNRSGTEPASTFRDLVFKETVFMGRANFAGIDVSGGRAYFPLTVFEGEADFKGADFHAEAEFRFASFGKGANFRFLRMYEPVYFGGTRFRDDMVFADVYSERDVYFNEALFEGTATFFGCEFLRGATFESSRFGKAANFGNLQVKSALNLSRVIFGESVIVREVTAGSLDAFGTHFAADASFEDATVLGRTRFSLDDVTRSSATADGLDSLLPLYRRYQGDEDADEPITTRTSYGVTSFDDLNARIDGNISFANTTFGGYTVFQGVTFGREGVQTVASFFNSQFQGESHFERTDWFASADFTTIFGSEVAFNGAHFRRSLILDDAAVSKRVTLTGASFDRDADLSFFGAEIASFQIDPHQVLGEGEPHRLFYERCARGPIATDDVRIQRILVENPDLDQDGLHDACYENVVDEFTTLKGSYGDRAMTVAEDDAYWWTRHHHAMRNLWYGSFLQRVKTLVVSLLVFELCFGWGVRLGNLAIAAIVVTFLYAVLYRVVCADTVLQFNGDDVHIRDVPFLGLWYVSIQAMIAVNTGWDFGEDDHRFRILNVSETVVGFIMLTFFVGAYTRMILS